MMQKQDVQRLMSNKIKYFLIRDGYNYNQSCHLINKNMKYLNAHASTDMSDLLSLAKHIEEVEGSAGSNKLRA